MDNVISVNGTNGTSFELDPDIAGPGVQLGFIITGFVAYLASCSAIVLRNVANDDSDVSKRLRRHILGVARWCSPADEVDPAMFWSKALEQLVLSLSDQQLVTGILLLVVAYIRYIPTKQYESFSIAVDVAAFATVTHLSTLWALRSYLREHRRMTKWRLGIMSVTLALLIAGEFIPLASLEGAGVRITTLSQVASLPWLSLGTVFPIYASDLTMTSRKVLYLSLASPMSNEAIERTPIVRQHWEQLQSHSALSRCRKFISSGGLSLFPMPLDKSKLTRLVILFYLEFCIPSIYLGAFILSFFALGIVNLAVDISSSGLETSWSGWGFGQLLPIFMNILPVLTLIESYSEKLKERQRTTSPVEDGIIMELPHRSSIQSTTLSQMAPKSRGLNSRTFPEASSSNTAPESISVATVPRAETLPAQTSRSAYESEPQINRPVRRASTLRHVV